jgi:chemotaxis protein CheX
MALSFPVECIRVIVSCMLGERIEDMEELGDGVAEILNMVSRGALAELEKMGLNLDATMPTVIIGDGGSAGAFYSHPEVAVAFLTRAGTFFMVAGTRERSLPRRAAAILPFGRS